MKINTNSWHFRFLLFLDRTPSDNLCWYFWQVVGNLIGFSIMVVFVSLAVIIGSFLLAMPLLAWVLPWSDPANLLLLAILSVLLWLVLGVNAITFVRSHRIGRGSVLGKSLFPEGPIVKSEDSFLAVAYQWLKAKKEKVCPRLEFVDEE